MKGMWKLLKWIKKKHKFNSSKFSRKCSQTTNNQIISYVRSPENLCSKNNKSSIFDWRKQSCVIRKQTSVEHLNQFLISLISAASSTLKMAENIIEFEEGD